jgi:two-component system nitrate/nitrite response regulator NarL
MRQGPVATIIIGPDGLRREGLRQILGAADFNVVAAVSSVVDIALSQLPQDQSMLLIVVISNDQDATIKQIKLFREQHPTARIVLLDDHDQLSESNIVAAFREGARAYFQKPSYDIFIKSLELVMMGESILPARLSSYFIHDQNSVSPSDVAKSVEELAESKNKYTPRLSAREKFILRCLAEGDSNKTIARKNDIAVATAKIHVKAILRKIRVANRTQAAMWAMKNDWILK